MNDAVPGLYVLEGTVSGSQRLQGVFLDGTLATPWDVSPSQPGTSDVWLTLADRAGGVVLGTQDWSTGTGGLVRIPGTPDAVPWRYDSPASASTVVGQSPDGTIYLLEYVGQSWEVVGLDGDTGAVRFRHTPAGTSHYALYNIDCHAGYHSISESGPELSRGVVGYDGALYAIVRTSTSVYDYYSQEGCNQSTAIPSDYRATVSVVRVTADGAGSVYELQTKAGTTSDALNLQGDTLVPDPRGGVHAQWNSITIVDWSTYERTGDARHARVGAESSGGQQIGVLPFDRIGDGVGFDVNGVAYDLESTAVSFSPAVAGTFVTALAGGGVAVTDGETVTTLDEDGQVVDTPSRLPRSVMSGLPATFGGGDLWPVIEGEKLSFLAGRALPNEPVVYPASSGGREPSGTRRVEVGIDFYWDRDSTGSEGLSLDELALVKTVALQTLQGAFSGYQVYFSEDRTELPHHIRVRDMLLGGQGETDFFRTSRLSYVNFPTVASTLRTVVDCRVGDWDACARKLNWSRADIARALGRGVGVTAAHELGHQGGLSFTRHKGGLDNYDGFYDIPRDGPYPPQYWVYYLGQMTWSDDAKKRIEAIVAPVK